MPTADKFNSQLQSWFSHNKVETNKAITPIARETFVILYNYKWVYDHPHGKAANVHFKAKLAKTIAFFAMTVPDNNLSRIMQSFSAFRSYLQKLTSHQIDRKNYHVQYKDLSSYDKNMLDLIFSFYHPEDYDRMAASVYDGYSFIYPQKLMDKIKTHDARVWSMEAESKNLTSPIEVGWDETKHCFTLRDAMKIVDSRAR